jgi:hypothetical protein
MGLGGSARQEPRGKDFKRLAVGGGDVIYKVRKATVSVNPADLGTLTKAGTAVTVAGVAVGDIVIATPPATLEDDLIPAGAVVTNTDEVTIYLYNPTLGSVNGAALNWVLTIIEFS